MKEPFIWICFHFCVCFDTIALRNWTHERTSIAYNTLAFQCSARSTCCLASDSIVSAVYYGFCSVIYKWNKCTYVLHEAHKNEKKQQQQQRIVFCVWSYMRELIFSFGIWKFVRATRFDTHAHTHTPDRSVMQDLHVLPLDFRHQTFWWTHKALAYDNVMHSYSIYLRVNFTSIFLSFNFIPSEHSILLSSVLTAYCSLVCNDAICFVQFCRKTHFNRSRHSLHFSQSSIVVGSIRHVAIEMEII